MFPFLCVYTYYVSVFFPFVICTVIVFLGGRVWCKLCAFKLICFQHILDGLISHECMKKQFEKSRERLFIER